MSDPRPDPRDPADVEISGPNAPGSLRGTDRDPPRPPRADDPIDVAMTGPDAPGSLRGQDFHPPRGSQPVPGSRPSRRDPIDVDMTGPGAPGSLRGRDADPPRAVVTPRPGGGSGSGGSGSGGGGGNGGSGGRRPWRGWRFVGPAVGGLLLGALLFWLFPGFTRGFTRLFRGEDPGAVVLAHVADPRLASASGHGPSNSAVVALAMRTLRARSGVEVPAALVLSGDIHAPRAAPAATDTAARGTAAADSAASDTTAGDTTRTDTTRTNPATADTNRTTTPPTTANPPATNRPATTTTTDSQTAAPADTGAARAGEALGRVLAAGPTAEVYLVPKSPLPPAFTGRMQAPAESAGVHVYDLTQCYAATEGIDGCYADLAGTRYRLVGAPALPADSAALAAALARLEALVDDARADRRLALVAVAALPPAGAPDSLMGRFRRLADRDAVAAVLADDPAGEARVAAAKLVRTPALGSASAAPSASRGFSVVRMAGSRPAWSTVRFDPGSGTFVRAPLPPAPVERGPLGRLYEAGDGIGEPARRAIFWMAVLTAFLTVAALWKVPAPGATTVTATATDAAGGGTATATAAAAGAAAGAAAAGGDDGSVFKSNLGRTVASGLAGIAAVTVLKDVWGVSGTAGQAFFATVFIVLFLLFLAVVALVRAAIEALRSRVATEGGTATGAAVPWWRDRTTALVFFDTAMNVLFGQSQVLGEVWEKRFVAIQERLVSTAGRVREEVSAAIGDALRARGVDAVEDRDFRVNVTLLSAAEDEVYYLAAARGSAAKVFDSRSVAYVAVYSGEARWWKLPYQGGRRWLRSEHPLAAAGGLRPATRLAELEVEPAPGSQSAIAAQPGAPAAAPAIVRVKATRGDGVVIDRSFVLAREGEEAGDTVLPAEATLADLLDLLNGEEGFGGGLSPAVASVDRDGHLLLAELGDRAGRLAVERFEVGGASLGAFAEATPDAVVLFRNAAPAAHPKLAAEVALETSFQDRGELDYEAFMVIPVPWSRRGLATGGRRGAIQLSFRQAHLMDALWTALERSGGGKVEPNYDDQDRLMEDSMFPHPVARASIQQGARVLAELIQEVNETWFRTGRGRRP